MLKEMTKKKLTSYFIDILAYAKETENSHLII